MFNQKHYEKRLTDAVEQKLGGKFEIKRWQRNPDGSQTPVFRAINFRERRIANNLGLAIES